MQTIYLDISNKGAIPCIYAKQSEVGRKFLAVITDSGVPYNIPDNSLLSVWYEGDTDAGNYSSINEESAFSIDGNKVTVELVAQMLFKPGNGELCLSITHGDGGETNTWNIPYCVEYKPGAGSAVPTEYYTALTNAAGMAAEQVGFARDQVEIAKQHADAAEQYAEAAKETVLGYVSADGSVPMSGNLDMGGNAISNVSTPTKNTDAANKNYVDSVFADPSKKFVKSDGSVAMSGVFNAGGNRVSNVGTPTADTDAVNRSYFALNLFPHLGVYGASGVNIDDRVFGIYTSQSSSPIVINGRSYYNGFILSLVNHSAGGVQIAALPESGYLAIRSKWYTNPWSGWVDIK